MFEAYEKQGGSFVGDTVNLFYDNATVPVNPSNNSETVFFKPAETPRDMDIQHLIGSAPASLQPGEIKHSVLFNTFEMSFLKYFELLFTNKTNLNNVQGGNGQAYYNQDLGVCNTIVLEKAIGRKPLTDVNDIKLWVQLQYNQSILFHGRNRVYTLPIQFQTDFD